MDGEYHPLPARMLFTPAPLAASAPKTFSVNLAVTVTPTTAAAKPLDWAVDFVNADSEWASGKTVTDYVTVTPTVDGAKTATVTCLKAFGEQIKITVTTRENPNATATCLLDYKQQLLSYDLSVAQAGKSPTVNVSRKSRNYSKRKKLKIKRKEPPCLRVRLYAPIAEALSITTTSEIKRIGCAGG